MSTGLGGPGGTQRHLCHPRPTAPEQRRAPSLPLLPPLGAASEINVPCTTTPHSPVSEITALPRGPSSPSSLHPPPSSQVPSGGVPMTPAAPALAYDPQPNIQWGGVSQEPSPSPVTPAPIPPPQGGISWAGSERLMCHVPSLITSPCTRAAWDLVREVKSPTQGLEPTPSHPAAACSI